MKEEEEEEDYIICESQNHFILVKSAILKNLAIQPNKHL